MGERVVKKDRREKHIPIFFKNNSLTDWGAGAVERSASNGEYRA